MFRKSLVTVCFQYFIWVGPPGTHVPSSSSYILDKINKMFTSEPFVCPTGFNLQLLLLVGVCSFRVTLFDRLNIIFTSRCPPMFCPLVLTWSNRMNIQFTSTFVGPIMTFHLGFTSGQDDHKVCGIEHTIMLLCPEHKTGNCTLVFAIQISCRLKTLTSIPFVQFELKSSSFSDSFSSITC